MHAVLKLKPSTHDKREKLEASKHTTCKLLEYYS